MAQERHSTQQNPGSHPLVTSLCRHSWTKEVPWSTSKCEGNVICRGHTSFRGVIAVLPRHGWFAESSSEQPCVPPPGCLGRGIPLHFQGITGLGVTQESQAGPTDQSCELMGQRPIRVTEKGGTNRTRVTLVHAGWAGPAPGGTLAACEDLTWNTVKPGAGKTQREQ